ncbi:inorganic phosphate transporter [Devosia epidermidihirudinis]|uniref:Phosphate transporter n=2 Tax=Devosia epidermidihirudinis TaxID=1293439 RepID=A0A0F5Q6L9_9HYPH|nr:inorganic phosphate transporter [Devosia epidermidihirudinis]KKC35679.1 inorganic phosphate transporter [Devosia epidermidihirudinis]
MPKSALDKDLQRVSGLETATNDLSRSLAAPGLALVFLVLAMLWASHIVTDGPGSYLVIIAAVIAGYMALNVGANDVANNMGPAVGANALTMLGALVIAAIFEAAGALLAGGDVVNTLARDLVTAETHMDDMTFVLVMMSALLASALWLNIATYVGAPVSTTHAVVGGIVGAAIAAAGFHVVAWANIATIASSWVISPVLGGMFAALFLILIQLSITGRVDKVAAARRWVPIFIAVTAATFTLYLATKGLSRIWKPAPWLTWTLAISIGVLAWILSMPLIRKQSLTIENRTKHVASLFRIPLIVAAALMSFAHGANDVSNAVGPLAAIVDRLQPSEHGLEVGIPFWVMFIGASGIALGLALFGPRLIRTVGAQITKLNEIRAFCVALSAAVTVLAASAFGLPVSSTHIAIGGIFGVGFLREYWQRRAMDTVAVPRHARHVHPDMLNATPELALTRARKQDRRRLVRRQHVLGIAAAWVVTVPATATLSAVVYAIMNLFMH